MVNCDIGSIKYNIDASIDHIKEIEETIFSYFIGEKLKHPYYHWVDRLFEAKSHLRSILSSDEFKELKKEEDEYYKQMRKDFNLDE